MKSTDEEGVDFSSLPALPKNWSWCVPSDICKVVASGSTPPPEKMFEDKGEIPFIKVYNLTHTGLLDFSVRPTFIARSTHEGHLKRSRTQSGDVLINIVGPPLGKVSMVPDDHPEWNINQAIVVFRPEPGISRRYIKYAFLNEEIMSRVTSLAKATAGQSNIGVSMCRNRLPVPLSPENEQVRIVSKIEELFSDLDAGVASLLRVQANLKRYRAAVLKAAIEGKLTEDWRAKHPDTKPASLFLERILVDRRSKWEQTQLTKLAQTGKQPSKGWQAKYKEPEIPEGINGSELPSGWCWATVEQITSKVVDGVHKKPNYVSEGIPFVSVRNLTAGPGISFEKLNYITEEDHQTFIRRADPERGDLLISKDGTLGVTRVVRTDKQFSIFVSVALLKPIDTQISEYLGYALASQQVQARMISKGIGLQHIHLEDMRKVCVPIPPMDEQQQIVDEVERHISVINEIEAQVDANLKRTSRLRQGILKRAFDGRLVPQDPNDEPADQLLARIRDQRQSTPTSTNGKPRSRRPGSPRNSRSATPLFDQDDGDNQGGES